MDPREVGDNRSAFLDIFKIKEEPLDWSEWKNEKFSFEIKTADDSEQNENPGEHELMSTQSSEEVQQSFSDEVLAKRQRNEQTDEIAYAQSPSKKTRVSLTRTNTSPSSDSMNQSMENVIFTENDVAQSEGTRGFITPDSDLSSICNFCNKTLANRWNKARHEREVHHSSQQARKSISCPKKTVKTDIDSISEQISHPNTEKRTRSMSARKSICSVKYNELKSPTIPEVYTFKCKLCAEVFTDLRAKKRHKLLMHTVAPPSKHETTENRSDYDNQDINSSSKASDHTVKCRCIGEQCGHSQRAPSGRLYIRCRCKICQQTLATKASLKRHMRTVHSQEETYTCEVCHKTFSTRLKLSVHLGMHAGKRRARPTACKVCGKVIAHLGNLSRHMKIHDKEASTFSSNNHEGEKYANCTENIKEEQSKRTADSEGGTDDENEQPTGKQSFKSRQTNNITKKKWTVAFSWKSKPKLKLKVHHSYKCSRCSLLFSKKSLLIKHSLTHRSKVRKKRTCQICSLSVFDLNRHLRTHDIKQPSKSQRSQDQLPQDKKPSNGIRQKKKNCSVCSKEVFNLTRHLRTHGAKEESKGHKSQGHKTKTQTQRDVKKIKTCPVCMKSVVNFARHLRIHSGEKPYKCKFCEKKYSDWTGRKRHQEKCVLNIKVEIEGEEQLWIDQKSPHVLVSKLDLNDILAVDTFKGEQMSPLIYASEEKQALKPQQSNDVSGSIQQHSKIMDSVESIVFKTLESVVDHVASLCDLGLPIGSKAFEIEKLKLNANFDYFDYDKKQKENHLMKHNNQSSEDVQKDRLTFDKSLDNLYFENNQNLLKSEAIVLTSKCINTETMLSTDVSKLEDNISTKGIPPRTFSKEKLLHMKKTLSKLKFPTKNVKRINKNKHCCPTCGLTFSSRGKLTSHLKLHSVERPYACDICQRRYSDERSFKRHKLTHLEDKPFKCPICKKGFITNREMQRHMSVCERVNGTIEMDTGQDVNEKGTPEQQKYECSGCGAVFKFEFSLRRHQKLNLKENRCDVCQVVFICRYVLLNHQKYQCTNKTLDIVPKEKTDQRNQINSQNSSLKVLNQRANVDCKDKDSKVINQKSEVTSKKDSSIKVQRGCDTSSKLKSPPSKLKSPARVNTPERSIQSPNVMKSPTSKSPGRIKSPRLQSPNFSLSPSKTRSRSKPTALKTPPIPKLKSPTCKTSISIKSPSIKSPLIKSPSSSSGSNRSVSQTRMIEDFLDIQCKQCGGSFKKYEQFVRHMKMHSVDREYECPVCKKRYNSASGLYKHKLLHGDYRMHCQICNKGFFRNYLLQDHLVKCRQSNEADSLDDSTANGVPSRVGCNLPNKECNSLNKKEKQKLHLAVRKQRLSVLKKKTTIQNQRTVSTTVRPNSTRTDENLHVCDQCEKSFASSTSLILHKRIHVDKKKSQVKTENSSKRIATPLKQNRPKNYSCNVCHKSYDKISNLKYHSVVHTGEKLSKCDICQKRFSTPSVLSKHRKRHLTDGTKTMKKVIPSKASEGVPKGSKKVNKKLSAQAAKSRAFSEVNPDKTFKCQECGKRFERNYDLKSHTFAVHRESGKQISWWCSYCGRKYMSKGSLRKHQRKAHPDKQQE